MSTESVLAKVPLFAGLDAGTIESLEAFTFRASFSPGELIVEEGRTGNGLFIILSGQVEVFRNIGGDKPQILRKMGPGEPLGEMALLGEWPRTASVRATEPTECLGMDRWIFLAHLDKEPQLAIRMLQILARRLANTVDRLEE
jgi:CRP/FNR family transcriptional regulator, cyclic AMP receptor protein